MKIESLGKSVGPVPLSGTRSHPDSLSGIGGGEKVDLSPLASTLQKAEAALEQTPVADHARVEEIKQAIRDGRFKVDANRIADGLIADVRQILDAQTRRA
ncbi:MAG: flagellar biosynthesis anti-sigma factor FlgM [Azoarcus sp.]|jgi:negative regulator of flagellin synthesis FlgM|nr:flagellar biosynthesis anti-sigma factor FlgM [Azoarcus sp.]